jgi:hypothetical protein
MDRVGACKVDVLNDGYHGTIAVLPVYGRRVSLLGLAGAAIGRRHASPQKRNMRAHKSRELPSPIGRR